MEWGGEGGNEAEEFFEGSLLSDLMTRERTWAPFTLIHPVSALSPIFDSKPQPSTPSCGPFALYICSRKYFVEHSLCHNPLDIVGIAGGVPALLWAGMVHREELKHTYFPSGSQSQVTTPSLFQKLQGSVDAHSPTPPWGSYLHIYDAAGLRGCEPEDFESKTREISDAH